MNNRRLTKKKQVQLLVALTLLAWATQTLMHQWGFGQEVTPDQSSTDQSTNVQASPDSTQAMDVSDLPSADKFVPGGANCTPAGTLELRQEANIAGADVSLKQVCRWGDGDASVFTPIADLTVLHLSAGVGYQSVGIDQIRQTLHDAGVNIAMINFAGATSCNITRSDGQSASSQTVEQWLDSQQPQAGKPVMTPVSDAAKPDPNFHILRDLLTDDLSQRLSIPADMLQITFSADDQKVLGLAEPLFKFDIAPSRAQALGNVSWQVTVSTDSASKKITLQAVARAWEEQVIVAKALSMHEVLDPSDFTTRRVLVDSMPAHVPLHIDQVAGMEAAEDLHLGTVLTSMLVNPIPLVKPGQLVTVNLRRGTIQLRAVARAMEQGSMGQTIRVRNENSRDVLDVTVTGSQEARLGADQAAAVEDQNAAAGGN